MSDMDFRPVVPTIGRPPVFEPGPAPMLQWVKVEDLVIDPTYQRPISGQGHGNVKRIAHSFNWSKFAPVILAPVAGGKFAVIDGQHRATAAAANGIDQVPAMVVIADRAQQAESFAAVNGVVTKMTRTQLFAAQVAARSPEAVALQEACEAAGVTIVRSNKASTRMQAGETTAVARLEACLAAYGRDTLVTALMCVTETELNDPGALTSFAIGGLCLALHEKPAWRDAGEALFVAIEDFDLEEATTRARVKAVGTRGTSVTEHLATEVTVHLSTRLGGGVILLMTLWLKRPERLQ